MLDHSAPPSSIVDQPFGFFAQFFRPALDKFPTTRCGNHSLIFLRLWRASNTAHHFFCPHQISIIIIIFNSDLQSGDYLRPVEPRRPVRGGRQPRGGVTFGASCNRRGWRTSTYLGLVRPGRRRTSGSARTRSVPGKGVLHSGGEAFLCQLPMVFCCTFCPSIFRFFLFASGFPSSISVFFLFRHFFLSFCFFCSLFFSLFCSLLPFNDSTAFMHLFTVQEAF